MQGYTESSNVDAVSETSADVVPRLATLLGADDDEIDQLRRAARGAGREMNRLP